MYLQTLYLMRNCRIPNIRAGCPNLGHATLHTNFLDVIIHPEIRKYRVSQKNSNQRFIHNFLPFFYDCQFHTKYSKLLILRRFFEIYRSQ